MQEEPTKSRVNRSSAVDVSVMPLGGEWVVKRSGAARRTGVYPTQDDAVRAAQALTRSRGGQVVIHGRDGSLRGSFTLGRLAFEKISAVEGIRLSTAMKRDLRQAAETGTSDSARQDLAAKYGKSTG